MSQFYQLFVLTLIPILQNTTCWTRFHPLISPRLLFLPLKKKMYSQPEECNAV
jgi:hypothetical protein